MLHSHYYVFLSALIMKLYPWLCLNYPWNKLTYKFFMKILELDSHKLLYKKHGMNDFVLRQNI